MTYTYIVTRRTLWQYNGYLFGHKITESGDSLGKNGKEKDAVELYLSHFTSTLTISVIAFVLVLHVQ